MPLTPFSIKLITSHANFNDTFGRDKLANCLNCRGLEKGGESWWKTVFEQGLEPSPSRQGAILNSDKAEVLVRYLDFKPAQIPGRLMELG